MTRRTVTRHPCAAFTTEELRAVLTKRAHDQLHDDWKRHTRTCDRCGFGYSCRIATALADAADVAGTRWERAEAEAARTARLAAV